MYYGKFGGLLKHLREEKGITQSELGSLVGATKAVISKYENSLSYPSYDVLVRLADVFKVSTDFLLGVNKTKIVDVSSLTDSQIDSIVKIVNEFEKANKKG